MIAPRHRLIARACPSLRVPSRSFLLFQGMEHETTLVRPRSTAEEALLAYGRKRGSVVVIMLDVIQTVALPHRAVYHFFESGFWVDVCKVFRGKLAIAFWQDARAAVGAHILGPNAGLVYPFQFVVFRLAQPTSGLERPPIVARHLTFLHHVRLDGPVAVFLIVRALLGPEGVVLVILVRMALALKVVESAYRVPWFMRSLRSWVGSMASMRRWEYGDGSEYEYEHDVAEYRMMTR